MTINKEKVDARILHLLEDGVSRKHRSIIGVCGKVKDVAHHVHSLLSRYVMRPQVLWVYEKDLEVKAHKIGKAKKRREAGECVLSNFESFVVNTDINYVFHSEADRVLGTTTDLCILQDFSKIRANSLASVVESVRGGGVILLPVEETDSIYTKRLYNLLQSADSYIVIDQEMKVLRSAHTKKIEEENKENTLEEKLQKIKDLANPLNPLSIISANSTTVLMRQCKTEDQAEAVLKLSEVLDRRSLVAVTADRGRGKSAALGLAISHGIVKGMNDIMISAPHLSNVQTVFEFIVIGLVSNGYKEQFDFFLEYSKSAKKSVEKITISKTHYQTIRFVSPQKLSHSPSMLVVDEAAAVPLTVLKEMLGMYPTLISSTTAGYEGTGRALSLKLFKSLNPEIIRLEEPIRYSRNDPVEKWLNNSLSLAPEIPKMATFPKQERCKVYAVNKRLLFSGEEETEKILRSLSSILLSGHYKNSPNDLQTLAEDINHTLLVLLTEEGRVLGLAQCVKEGSKIEMENTQKIYNEKRTEKGNLIPWSISQYFLDMEIFEHTGLRIIRIAIHPDAHSMGYGSYLINEIVRAAEDKEEMNKPVSERTNRPSTDLMFFSPSFPGVEYVGVSFGVTQRLLDFWLRLGMKAVYLKHTLCKTTGEHSLIMMKGLTERSTDKIEVYRKEFTERFLELLPGCFSSVPTIIALQLITPSKEEIGAFTESQLKRMQQFSRCNLDLRIVVDLLPYIAKQILLCKKQIVSTTQKIIILATGLQHKTLEGVSQELKLQPAQVKMLIAKGLSSICSNKTD